MGSTNTQAGIYATPRRVERFDDCNFYTSLDIPGVGSVEGSWDLRSGVDEYLGHVDFAGKRVLEIGPASGFLTFAMEHRGAGVVGVEMGDWRNYEFIPRPNLNVEELDLPPDKMLEKMTNGFWYAHRAFQSSSRVHYGTAYDLPDELGTFDISTMGSVLLHNRDPLAIVQQCAQRTEEKIIVVDIRNPGLSGPIARLAPSVDNDTIDTWWTFTPEFFTQFLAVLGFPRSEVSFHEQLLFGKPWPLFTVVASR